MQLRASRTEIDQGALHPARISHTGADMHFLRLGGGGMRARIEQADAHEHFSIQHLGEA